MAEPKMHDFEGERGRAVGPTGLGVGADSKIVTVGRTAGPGVLKWASGYPKPVKDTYNSGEVVQMNFVIYNEGDTGVPPKIVITDADTGAAVYSQQFVTNVPPKAFLDISGIAIGNMPGKDQWRLKCDVTP